MPDKLKGSYAKRRESAWQYYKTWMKEKTFCKALNSEVRITRKGWDHITRGTRSKRKSLPDKSSRLNLLKQAKFLIKNATIFTIAYRRSQKHYILEGVVRNQGKQLDIKVVIKVNPEGVYYFLSVMKT